MANKIFISCLETFGDVVLMSTICRNIKLRYPDAEITFLTDPRYKGLLENNPDIYRIWDGQIKNFQDVYVKSMYDKFQHVYFPMMVTQEDTMWHHDLEARYHLVDFYAKRCDNLVLSDRRTFIYPDDKDKQKVEEEFVKYPLLKERVPVSIHVSSPVASKSWGVKNFKKLVIALERMGCVVMQVGAESDEKVQTPSIVNMCGKLTPRQTAWALSKTMMYVGIDSGPAYLADSMGVPSVILYGATTHIQAGPLSPLSIPLEPQRKQEFPCGPSHMTCSTHCQIGSPCILTLEPEHVIQFTVNMLNGIVQKIAEYQKKTQAIPAS